MTKRQKWIFFLQIVGMTVGLAMFAFGIVYF